MAAVERTLKLKDIRPYASNARRITDQAVDEVAVSIEKYGYRQPIVVDSSNVVVVGHTRLRALKKLGWTEATVLVTDLPEDKVRAYRLVDNRTAEMGQWDHSALVLELREFEAGVLERYFPDLDLELGQAEAAAEVTEQDMIDATEKVTTVNPANPQTGHTTDVVCPQCAHLFPVRTKSLPGVSDELLERLTDGQKAS